MLRSCEQSLKKGCFQGKRNLWKRKKCDQIITLKKKKKYDLVKK